MPRADPSITHGPARSPPARSPPDRRLVAHHAEDAEAAIEHLDPGQLVVGRPDSGGIALDQAAAHPHLTMRRFEPSMTNTPIAIPHSDTAASAHTPHTQPEERDGTQPSDHGPGSHVPAPGSRGRRPHRQPGPPRSSKPTPVPGQHAHTQRLLVDGARPPARGCLAPTHPACTVFTHDAREARLDEPDEHHDLWMPGESVRWAQAPARRHRGKPDHGHIMP
jgi:hypothetical protein